MPTGVVVGAEPPLDQRQPARESRQSVRKETLAAQRSMPFHEHSSTKIKGKATSHKEPELC